MIHIKTRSQLINHVASTTKDSGIRDALNHEHVMLWGRFKGGWVLETWGRLPMAHIFIGIKPDGICGQRLISGRLSAIPWADYIGGDHGIDQGDHPHTALARKRHAEQLNTPRQGEQDNTHHSPGQDPE